MEMNFSFDSARLIGLSFMITVFLKEIVADFELCNPGSSTAVYQFIRENCPFGVLFDHPITVTCLASTNYPESFITDLCNPEAKRLSINDRPFQIHLAFQMDPEPVDVDSSCKGVGSDKCNVNSMIVATNETLTPPVGETCDTGYNNGVVNLSSEEEARRRDVYVFNQTERLFKYMLGLITDDIKESRSELRLVRLLKHCFKIFKKFSDPAYIPLDFGKDVQKAFLFLFRESDSTNFKDIAVDDFQIIERTLTECEKMAPPFKLIGRKCTTCANIYGIEKMGKTLRYTENEFSFVWGEYDVPTDATWNIVTFVHGLCYGTYRLHVNYHHLYEREMEKLFTPELQYRWNKPPLLYHEDLWDHIFSSSVKNAMKNLDVYIFGAYHDSPFLHQLERPTINYEEYEVTKNDNNGKRTKRRSKRSLLPTMSIDDGGLKGAGWCFQSEDELVGTVGAFMSYHCPHLPVPPEILGKVVVDMSTPNPRDTQIDLQEEASDSLEFSRSSKLI